MALSELPHSKEPSSAHRTRLGDLLFAANIPGFLAERGGTRLGVSTAPVKLPEGRTTTLPRPIEPPPPIEESVIREANELLRQSVRINPEINLDKPKRRNRLLVKAGLIAGGLIALGGGIWGVTRAFSGDDDNTSPTTQSQSIESPNSFNLEFYKRETSGEITSHNSVLIHDTESLKKMSPIPAGPNPNHDIFLLTPRLGPPPEEGINYKKDLTGKNANNPIYAPGPRQYAIENGVNNKITIKVKKGEEIPAPVPGPNVQFMYDRIRNDIPEGTVDSATFLFKDDKNTLHQVRVGDSSGKPLEPTMPDIKPRGIKDDYKNFLHPNEVGKPVLRALDDGEIVMFVQAWPSGQFGVEVTSSNKVQYVYPTNINLIGTVDLDPSSTNNKAVLLDKPTNTP